MLTQEAPSNSKVMPVPTTRPSAVAMMVAPTMGMPSSVTSAIKVFGMTGRTTTSMSGSLHGSSPSQRPSPSVSARQLPSQSRPSSANVQEPSSRVASSS